MAAAVVVLLAVGYVGSYPIAFWVFMGPQFDSRPEIREPVMVLYDPLTRYRLRFQDPGVEAFHAYCLWCWDTLDEMGVD